MYTFLDFSLTVITVIIFSQDFCCLQFLFKAHSTELRISTVRGGAVMISTPDQQLVPCSHKVLTFIEYRAVCLASSELLTPPTPSPPSECVLPPRAVRGWGGNISDDARHWIVLLQYNPSTRVVHFRYTI